MSTVPVIDLSAIATKEGGHDAESVLKDLGHQITDALYNIGFLYVTNHGISQTLIDSCSELHQKFFALEMKNKMKYVRDWKKSFCGYLPLEGDVELEQFQNAEKEYKEIFSICPNCATVAWPEKDLPGYEKIVKDFFLASEKLVRQIMLLVGHGMELEDPEIFERGHEGLGTTRNSSVMRAVLYPPVKDIIPGWTRCGEHTDYGSVTLLYLDSTPGLQVFSRQNEYIDIDPMEGAILVNLGDLMQRWSGDRLRAAKHRVIFRPDTYQKPRYSLIHFVNPDDDVLIRPVVGDPNKYEAVLPKDHLNRRMDDTFGKGKGIDQELLTDYRG